MKFEPFEASDYGRLVNNKKGVPVWELYPCRLCGHALKKHRIGTIRPCRGKGCNCMMFTVSHKDDQFELMIKFNIKEEN